MLRDKTAGWVVPYGLLSNDFIAYHSLLRIYVGKSRALSLLAVRQGGVKEPNLRKKLTYYVI